MSCLICMVNFNDTSYNIHIHVLLLYPYPIYLFRFNCQFHSQLEKSTMIFLTLQIISHFLQPIHNQPLVDHFSPISFTFHPTIPLHTSIADRRSFLFFRDTLWSITSPQKSSKTTQILTEDKHVVVGIERIRSQGTEFPVLRFVESNTFARHFVAIELWPQYIAV